ncbi:unnamed protein product [Rotaria sp. Silwood1]|nr:unnamed protein product [Rotaria sp. Silwood1]CAF1152110.1 unnamed protein product [Rotaria sp. Silwood1]CAF3441155.1 unnamed protein product [Rotaria sp. Silwood1]CAF3471764.1 unnamed protein product [Rotaria sp. Silwood1]CAF4667061.1 unnamed protein product [Rotaria sp. Silwood1]
MNNNVVIYSLMDVNKRLDKITRDKIFTSDLTLLRRSSDGSIDPMIDPILDRFCLEILSKVHHNNQVAQR